MTRQKAKKELAALPLGKSKTQGFADFKVQALILIVIGFVFYTNSFSDNYALDDGIVIQNNDYVQAGFRGVSKILKTDAYESFYRHMGAKQQLSGGRYRPLSVVTFAIEQGLFGSKAKVKPLDDIAFVRHFMNVIYYILSIIILLYFLKTFIFKENPLIAFITCIIFLIHPIHTEVVANVKSRDEILSFLFITLTFIAMFRYRETKQIRELLYGLFFYFLALLSKEYAITLLILIPMLLYIVKGDTFKDSVMAIIPYLGVAVIYLLIRFSVVGKGAAMENPDVLNNPYMYATNSGKWATKIEVLMRYLKLLFYPSPLSSDYSFSTIPYTNFGNSIVWESIFIYVSMVVATIILFLRRNILAFALAFYLLHLLLISNFIFNVGATMGERMVYHSSFGFSIILAVMINILLKKIKDEKIQKTIGVSFALLITVWCGAKTIGRNKEWKDDITLFIADVQTVPNSSLANGNAGKAFVDLSEKEENESKKRELIIKGIYYLKRSILIHKEYVNGYLNLGVAYFYLKNYDKARENWETIKSIYPNNPFLKKNMGLLGEVYYNEAMTMGGKNPQEAIVLLEKAIDVDPENAEYWYNLGGACFTIKDYEKARSAWIRTLHLKPDYAEAQQGMKAIPQNNY